MTGRVRVDAQGRVVIPRRVRERMGIPDGGELELVETPEGVLLERPRVEAWVEIAEDGLPVIRTSGERRITNDETVAAIHAIRDGR